MKKKLIALTLALGIVNFVSAQQDQHFSMFAESPIYLNPAAAGFVKGDMQLFTNYRLQWSAISDDPYRTIAASADWRMFDQGGSYMGAGLMFFNDIAGTSNYQTNQISIPLNFSIQLAEKNFLAIGLQPGFYQRVLGNQNLTWDNQWTGVQFDPSINSGELASTQNFNVNRFDIGAGVYWDAQLTKDNRVAIGVSGQHLTAQRIGFTSEDDNLFRKLTLHGQMEFNRPLTGVTIIPAFAAFLQGPNKEFIIGSNYRFLLKSASLTTSYFEEISLSLGTFLRVGDAAIVNMMFDISGLSIGASYDFNISSLTQATRGLGGMEFFLRYRMEFGTRALRNNRVK